MSLATDGSPYPILLPASKITKYSKLPDWSYTCTINIPSSSFVAIWVFFVTRLFRRRCPPAEISDERRTISDTIHVLSNTNKPMRSLLLNMVYTKR